MTTTPRFSSRESAVRRIAAGLALVMTLGVVFGMSALADEEYDKVLIAQAEQAPLSGPVQVVVITAKRLPQG